MTNNKMTPFVKWVGGKRQVIQTYLKKYLPKEFNTYLEPFLGGGAMLAYLKPHTAIINDINKDLITTYTCLKQNYKKVLDYISIFQEKHSKEFYYQLRNNIRFLTNKYETAAAFLYLNKTCFNGMYRVNSSGKFNVPFNNKAKEDLHVYNLNNIQNWHTYLKQNDIQIYCQDFRKILKLAQPNDFVFCDPPYDYEENKKTFVDYSHHNFKTNEQIELANCLKELDKKHVKWMLTNHDTKLINELYKDFKIIKIKTNRMINSNANKRINTGKEVIIINYEI